MIDEAKKMFTKNSCTRTAGHRAAQERAQHLRRIRTTLRSSDAVRTETERGGAVSGAESRERRRSQWPPVRTDVGIDVVAGAARIAKRARAQGHLGTRHYCE